MGSFRYKARDSFGNVARGVLEAENAAATSALLKRMGYVPITIRHERQGGLLARVGERFSRARLADVTMMTRQLLTLQRAGVPLLTGLQALSRQIHTPLLRRTLGQMIKDIEGGAQLSGAFAKHPRVFNDLYVSMVRAGEASGTLDDILERLALLGEHEERVEMSIRSAVRYPLLVIGALGVGFVVLTTMVIPRFARLYAQFSVRLPFPTRVLIGINLLVERYWWALILVALACVIGFIRFIQTPRGRLWWDGVKLKAPVFGPLMSKIVMSRFSRVTGILVRSGIPIMQILDLVAGGIGNAVIERLIRSIRSSVNEGRGLSEPMEISGMFPPVVVQMVAAGEATGKLDELLLYVADYYDDQVEYMTKNLTALIEPVLIFILGLTVLFLALGIFLPMWNLIELFRA